MSTVIVSVLFPTASRDLEEMLQVIAGAIPVLILLTAKADSRSTAVLPAVKLRAKTSDTGGAPTKRDYVVGWLNIEGLINKYM